MMQNNLIGTHSPKIINSQIKQDAICAQIIADLPSCFISSQTVSGRELWALPRNAAEMPAAKQALEAAEGKAFVAQLPNFQDGALKQLLLPYRDSYIAIAPAPSAKVLNAVHLALSEKPNKYHNLQPIMAAWSNHGEQILEQKGKQRMFLTRLRQPKNIFRQPENSVYLRFDCHGLNISGGMLAVGAPAITAIGGMVHAWERDFGAEIRFAVGLSDMSWHAGAKRGTNYQDSVSANTRRQIRIVSDEICGNATVHLLLKSDQLGLLDFVKFIKNQINRFSGGTIWNLEIVEHGVEIQAGWIVEQNQQVRDAAHLPEQAALGAVLDMYLDEQTWGDKHTVRDTYSLNQVGYAFLEQPAPRNRARNGYDSAWAEPLFSAIKIGDTPEKSPFWERVEADNAVWWVNE